MDLCDRWLCLQLTPICSPLGTPVTVVQMLLQKRLVTESEWGRGLGTLCCICFEHFTTLQQQITHSARYLAYHTVDVDVYRNIIDVFA